MPRWTKTAQERLEDLSYKDPNSGCWIWNGTTRENGYGTFSYEGKKQSAHRVSYLLNKGPLMLGEQVHHSCDVPACVNPAHLWAGSQRDNIQDALRKGRHFTPFPLYRRIVK